ncbi:hypothetical protein [Streptomyces sp. NPDC006997]|uniref:hypothetical protein n=1 Tax=Streptomyces sp. NPDC006997 TaxID=3155356 RepID=UPI003402AF6E
MPTPLPPPAAACTWYDAGQDWDAIRVPRTVGLSAMTILGSRCGAVVANGSAVYYFVPTGTAMSWDVLNTSPLGPGGTVPIPSRGAPRGWDRTG